MGGKEKKPEGEPTKQAKEVGKGEEHVDEAKSQPKADANAKQEKKEDTGKEAAKGAEHVDEAQPQTKADDNAKQEKKEETGKEMSIEAHDFVPLTSAREAPGQASHGEQQHDEEHHVSFRNEEQFSTHVQHKDTGGQEPEV